MYANTVADLLTPGDDKAKLNDDGKEVKEGQSKFEKDKTPVYFCSRTDLDWKKQPGDAPTRDESNKKCTDGPLTSFPSLANLVSYGAQCKSCQRFQARLLERNCIRRTREAAESAVSMLPKMVKEEELVTEEMMVNKATKQLTLVASENPTLKQEETEVFLSLLTTPFLAVPLLLEQGQRPRPHLRTTTAAAANAAAAGCGAGRPPAAGGVGAVED